jgi:hypothetical protein
MDITTSSRAVAFPHNTSFRTQFATANLHGCFILSRNFVFPRYLEARYLKNQHLAK